MQRSDARLRNCLMMDGGNSAAEDSGVGSVGNDQVAFYDDGVGTSTFKPWAILGGAFGFGLKRNVIDIHKFACRNYKSDSRARRNVDTVR